MLLIACAGPYNVGLCCCCCSEGSAKGSAAVRRGSKEGKVGSKEVHAERLQQRKSRKREKVRQISPIVSILLVTLLSLSTFLPQSTSPILSLPEFYSCRKESSERQCAFLVLGSDVPVRKQHYKTSFPMRALYVIWGDEHFMGNHALAGQD